jgi:hypothetical protein
VTVNEAGVPVIGGSVLPLAGDELPADEVDVDEDAVVAAEGDLQPAIRHARKIVVDKNKAKLFG